MCSEGGLSLSVSCRCSAAARPSRRLREAEAEALKSEDEASAETLELCSLATEPGPSKRGSRRLSPGSLQGLGFQSHSVGR